jgi:hypothetical protein
MRVCAGISNESFLPATSDLNSAILSEVLGFSLMPTVRMEAHPDRTRMKKSGMTMSDLGVLMFNEFFR